MSDTQLQQLVINVGTTAQINAGIMASTITADMLSFSTDDDTYQLTSNIVTTLSSTATDSQYPSAKLFYDTCGDIETLINAL